MATITSSTFLYDGTARTAGEAWTINGGVLTIRTDTRVHADAPASFTCSLGATTISSTLGGGVLIDGRNVREVWFNSGSGTVPAIGTAITQGGVSGYLLGVWADLNSLPTAVGAAMPATGFIKFREVTGGWGRDSVTGLSATLIDTTGGTIFSNPDLVISYPVGGGGNAWSEELASNNTAGTFGAQVQKLLTTSKFIGLK